MSEKQAEKPRTKQLLLSTGQIVTVGPMAWRGYVSLKNAVIQQLGGSLGSLVGEFLAKTPDPAASFSLVAMGDYLPRLLAELNRAIDENTEGLILASCQTQIEGGVNALTPADIIDLRDAAAAVNDLAALVEKEKNCFAAALAKAATFFRSNTGTPSDFGGQAGNPS